MQGQERVLMKVCITIPIELGLHNQGVFYIRKQLTSSEEGTEWEIVSTTSAISAGTYLADLEPGQYQKMLEAANGQFVTSSTFQITPDARYIDQAGKLFTVAEDGTLLEQNDQQESSRKTRHSSLPRVSLTSHVMLSPSASLRENQFGCHIDCWGTRYR
jgi:hypothetical protein